MLTGEWTGIFSYPHSLPSTAFEAVLTDRDGVLAGTVSEPDLYGPGNVIAAIEGTRDGNAVRFGKYYPAGAEDDGYDMVAYSGLLSQDGNEISGHWDIPGEWSGGFIMIRRSAEPEAEQRKTAVTVDD
ncbi:hypothetical protein [Sphingomonas sp.]